MEQVTAPAEHVGHIPPPEFHPRAIDGNPRLMDQSYRLRYQVYCVERQYLNADCYPDQRERDDFDADSVHVGAVDANGDLVATARVIKPNLRGFPMFNYCAFAPDVRTLDRPGVMPVEVSRVSISRHCVRPQRRRRSEPFLTLVKSIMQGAKRAGATHLIGATDAAFHRWLVHYGLPYRKAGPEVDYYGPVTPCIMSLRELDEVILGRRYASLEGFPVGWDPGLWPDYSSEHEGSPISSVA